VTKSICKFAIAGLVMVAFLSMGAQAGVGETVYGITGATAGSSLISFDSTSPGTATTVGALSGIVQGHSVRAIDFRPADGKLYALSTSGSAFQLYTVDLASAALSPVGSGGTVSFSFPTRVSMDFNPAADRVRVVGGGAQNLRLNPITGALVLEDTNLAYVAGDPNAGGNPPFPIGVAYDNNDNDPLTTTTMYIFDFDNDVLSRVGSIGGSPTSPNSGQMTTIGGPPGGAFLTNDGGMGFDISGLTGIGYVSYADFNAAGAETFGTISLTTGLVSPIGLFSQLDVLDISVVPVPEPALGAVAGLLGLAGLGLRRRAR
jgi:Domain of unknown function (DUF4394)